MKCLILLFIPISLYSQEIDFHINTRNAKNADIFDYWIGGECTYIYDTSINFNVGANYERDDSINYHSYNFSISNPYWRAKYFKDTEQKIEYSSLTLHYPYKILKAGVDIIYTNKFSLCPYLSLSYKYINFDFSYHKDKTKFEYKINPVILKKGDLKLKLNISGIYFEKKYKWRNGLTLNYIL